MCCDTLTLVFTREQIKVHETRKALVLNSVPTFKELNIRMPDNGLVGRNLDKLEPQNLLVDIQHF